MINKTIAFSNKGGFWKSRYSFISSCFAFIDKLFFSSPTRAVDGDVCWEHNKNNTPRNKFYGGIPIASSLAVTFNKKPSSNKIYKSFSLEGTSNMSGLNSVIVNNSSDDTQRKNATISLLEERGGILYGNVGSIQKVTGTNIKAVGIVSSIQSASEDFPQLYVINISNFLSTNPIPASGEAKLFLSRIDVNGAAVADAFYSTSPAYTPALAQTVVQENVQGIEITLNGAQDLLLNNSGFDQDVDFEDYLTLGDLSFDANNSFKQGSEIFITFDPSNSGHAPSLGTPEIGAEDYLLHTPIDTASYTYILYAITPASTSGDSPKGQYADAIVTLGSENFELYSLNLEYEPTEYDHDLAVQPQPAKKSTKKPKSGGRKR